MYKKISIVIVVFAIFLFIKCRKTDMGPVLPPITQTGAGTFGCKVDGNVFVPYLPCKDAGLGLDEMSYSIGSAYSYSALPISIFISPTSESVANTFRSIFYFEIPRVGVLVYGTGNMADSLSIEYDRDFANGNFNVYRKSLGLGNSSFNITKLDTINNIIAGTFSFNLYRANGAGAVFDSVVVTEGRFDLKMNQPYIKNCSD
jgi:hypothetical protein